MIIGQKDKNGVEINVGDWLLTNEAGWRGQVVDIGNKYILEDSHGGFSSEPDWDQCEIIPAFPEPPMSGPKCLKKQCLNCGEINNYFKVSCWNCMHKEFKDIPDPREVK